MIETIPPPLASGDRDYVSGDRDYVSPGLAVVHPDAAFPRMRVGDRSGHPWPYLRRDIPHRWYVDERFPLMGFLNRDEATILHNIALEFRGKRALEIGSWLGWSTCHLALAGVDLDVVDPVHADPDLGPTIEASLRACGVRDRVHLHGERSPDAIHSLAEREGRKWSLFFIDGDHEGLAPLVDTLACRPYAEHDCAFVFHDLASPAVAAAIRFLRDDGFQVLLYQTAQIMGIAWRGNVTPPAHVPDPEVAWEVPAHLEGYQFSGTAGRTSKFEVRGATAFPSNFELPTSNLTHALPNVCIVTNELIGPFKNGGIGTAMTGLAETLAAAGGPVTVLYTGSAGTTSDGLDHWRAHYRDKGIDLVALTIEDTQGIEGPLQQLGFVVPWLVYTYLVTHRFDVVHFNDCRGEGNLALVAKRLGLAFHDALLVVALHSPSPWVLELNQTLPTHSLLAAFRYAEELSIRCADVLWSPSRYMLDWTRDHGFVLPEQAFIHQYALPALGAPHRVQEGSAEAINEIVFFGRLEERKGLRLFCNVLDTLSEELTDRRITVVFLGKPYTCGGMHSLDYLARRSKNWNFSFCLITDYGQPEAVAYLASGGKIAVMASPYDNSPCTVYEALAEGIPFLASRSGGIPELVYDDDRDKVLFEHTTEGLRAALLDALDHGARIARPAMPQSDTRKSWTAIHQNWRTLLPAKQFLSHVGPRRVVAIVDPLPGTDLDATLASLRACKPVRRVFVIDRTRPEELDAVLASLADDVVLLIHSGITVLEEPLGRVIETLRCEGVDGFLPAARITSNQRVIPHLGGCPPLTLFEGVTFTGGLLIRADALLRARRGRALAADSPFLGLGDLCVNRAALWPFPEAVFERAPAWKAPRAGSSPARIAAYGDCSAEDRYYIASIGFAATQSSPRSGKRQLAKMLLDAGLAPVLRAGVWTLRQARRVKRLLGR